MDFGTFSWVKFVELLPVYVASFGAVGLLLFTFWQVRNSREDASRRAAFEFFAREHQDLESINAERSFIDIFSDLPDDQTIREKFEGLTYDEEAQVLHLLNRQELLAVGILHGGICEIFAKDYMRTQFLADWDSHTKCVISAIREINEDKMVYKEISLLAEKWSKD